MDLIYILKAIVLAIVEGISEFIPISSTGHMILAGDLIGFHSSEDAFSNFYEVFIQAGAILAIVVLYRTKIKEILISLFKWEKRGKSFALVIIIASIPAVLAGVLFEEIIDKYLFNAWTVVIGLFVGAIILILAEKYLRKKDGIKDIENISWKNALGIGCFQCLSLWPGMSRSSSTITGGWVFGLSTPAAAEFSFFLAIPIMFGAAGFKSLKFGMRGGFESFNATQGISLGLGFIVAFIVALICVKGFITFISKKPMKYFGFYRIAISAVFVVLLLTGII